MCHESKTLFHWIPSSRLGGIEIAALTLIRSSPGVKHVVATAEISGPAVSLWRHAGAEVVHIKGWQFLLGLRWARNWHEFVKSRSVSQLVAWSPTRINLLLAPFSLNADVVIHIGSVGAFSRRARLQERITQAIFRSTCLPRLVACSNAARESAATEPIFAGLPIKVILNAVRPHFFEVGASRRFYANKFKRWGLHARLVSGKNHAKLIDAVKLLPPNLDFSLELVGDGPMRVALMNQVEAAGVRDRVQFLGPRDNPAEELSRWDAFIFMPSPEEGFGISAAEAMAAGLPCILADIPSLREVAGDTAFYADHTSAEKICARILEVMACPREAEAKAEAGRQRAVELFGPKEYAKAYFNELGG